MSESDWDTVTYLRKKPPKASQLRTQQNQNYQGTSCFSDGQVKHFDTCPPGQAINAAQRQGLAIETTKKYNAATNKQHQTSMNTAKLDRETEQLHHDTVGLEIGRLIQQGRQNKNLTQKDLATRINEKPQVINDYEAGRAVPNQQILTKIERIIGIKLRGREKGQSLSDQKPKKK